MSRLETPRRETPQTEASDPNHSVWVSANAGSGKTTVLVWRVIRLLMDGVPPARILCLTYTKAAAAHMANEVLKLLRTWVRLDDEALDAALRAIDPVKPSPARRAMARRLFAAALETPGGLKVQTIHAFCDRVLHMFPVEAQVPAGFEVLDALEEQNLIERARMDVLLEAGVKPGGALGRAFRLAVESASDDSLQKTLAEAVRAREKIARHTQDSMFAALSAALDLKAEETSVAIERDMLQSPNLPRSEWAALAAALEGFGGNALRCAKHLQTATNVSDDAILECYLSIFFTQDRTPRQDNGFGSKDVRDKVPRLHARFIAERDRLIPRLQKLRAARERERSLALFVLAQDVIGRYERAKRARGALDFADLVTKTAALLERETSAWVHFKLDGGITHILVDEAQDTSPEQWRIIAKLSEEFFAGLGASERPRTIFAVGDQKQSIFSFQGADPKSFDEMRSKFAARISSAGGSLAQPRLNDSWRSVETVLAAVDKIFDSETARRGLSAPGDEKTVHVAIRAKAPGMVELWEPVKSDKSGADESGWQAPLDTVRDSSAPMLLAKNIAAAVQHWTGGGLSVGVKTRDGDEPRRAARAGDIIVLVQKRGTLFNAILRALKQAGLPVAGADRLQLTDHIAVMDLMALGDALLLERDDLQLATVLKSPLFGLSEDDLFTLAHGRGGTLAQSLSEHAASSSRFRECAGLLDRWCDEALHLRPFDFYSRVLGRDGGRKKMIARLGAEAADALDEFLSRALAYEATETPSLQGFLGFLRRAGAEVKRDLETESHAVRVMTVHGVKGLEAPVIVLADTTALPNPRFDPKLLAALPANAPPDAEPAWIWAMNKDDDSPILAEARERSRRLREEEYRRLLYVALTRAADVLVVCGMLNDNQKAADKGSWYDLVAGALKDTDESTVASAPGFDGTVLRWRDQSLPPAEVTISAPRQEILLPEWLQSTPDYQDKRTRRLRPSLAVRPMWEKDPAQRAQGGLHRGVLIHRLLQSLPSVAASERAAAAGRYLASAAPELDAASRDAIATEVIKTIDDPRCAELFGAQSRAEAECVALIPSENGETIEISARIDRLLVTDGEIIFADFKSGPVMPRDSGTIADHHIAQLAAYRAALALVFPGRRLRGLLIFTAGPRVFEVPEATLAAAWNRLKTQGSPAFA